MLISEKFGIDLKDFRVAFEPILYLKGVKCPSKATLRKELAIVLDSYDKPQCKGTRRVDKDMPGGYATVGRRFYIQGDVFSVEKNLVDDYMQDKDFFSTVPSYNRNHYVNVSDLGDLYRSALDIVLINSRDFATMYIQTKEQLHYIMECYSKNEKVDYNKFRSLDFRFTE